MVKFGIYLSGTGRDFEALRASWVQAEQLGFDTVWTMDNTVGPYHGYTEIPVFEAYTILPALAQATSKIRFGTLVTPCGRRHPALLAKMTSILDIISGGRFILGMGAGDHPQYFLPWGMAYPSASERIAVLREELEVIKRLWTEDYSSFNGRYYTLDGAVNYPKPVQKPHPPILIALNFGKKLMPRLAAEYADGINMYIAGDDRVKELLSLVEQNCREFGRDFGRIEKSRVINVTLTEEVVDPAEVVAQQIREEAVRLKVPADVLFENDATYSCHVVGPPEKCIEGLRKQVELGFDHLIVFLAGSKERFAREVMPAVRAASG